jgi:hypothetical protein
MCRKCQGDGKLGWIDNVMGGKPKPALRQLKGNWTIEVERDLKAIYSVDLEKQLDNILGVEEYTDTEIIEDIFNETNKI